MEENRFFGFEVELTGITHIMAADILEAGEKHMKTLYSGAWHESYHGCESPFLADFTDPQYY